MSGLSAIFNLDGRPVSRQILARVADASGVRGPDAAAEWLQGPVGLGHRMLCTTLECMEEQQPHADETGQILLIHDGRVDNRDELRRDFTAHGFEPRNATDAELLLRAYQRWGEEFPAHVIGDFALVIWDGRRKTLFLARDPSGVRPLLYFNAGNTFVCGSEVRQFFEHPAFAPRPNEGALAGCFSDLIGNLEETIYHNVLRVAPGCSVSVSREGIRKRRFWDFNPGHSVRYKNDADYAQHFAELLREAVRCRLRSFRPVGLLFSGGLDSSAIGGMVNDLARGEGIPAPAFELYSLVFPNQDCDESEYISACADAWQVPVHAFQPKADGMAAVAAEIARTKTLPEAPSARGLAPIREFARERGVRVVLNGWGGDVLLSGNQLHHADLLGSLRLPSLLAQMRAERRLGMMDLETFLRSAIGPLVPESWRRARRRWSRQDNVPAWIDPDFAARVRLSERKWLPTAPDFPTHAQRRMYQEYWDYSGILELETYEPRWADAQVQIRSPFLDRRLLEFCMAIPEDQRWRGVYTKQILRNAMRALVPAEILNRTDKPDGSRAILPFLAEAGEKFFRTSCISSLGWVRPDAVLDIYRQTAAGWHWKSTPSPSYVWPLWFMLSAELWYRFLSGQQAASAPQQSGTPVAFRAA